MKIGDLERNGMLDSDALYKIIYEGKGKMPGFGAECSPQVAIILSDLLQEHKRQLKL